jgi:hypothetical protein
MSGIDYNNNNNYKPIYGGLAANYLEHLDPALIENYHRSAGNYNRKIIIYYNRFNPFI